MCSNSWHAIADWKRASIARKLSGKRTMGFAKPNVTGESTLAESRNSALAPTVRRIWLRIAADSALSVIGAEASRKRRSLTSPRSEEHTSELQSQSNLVCRLLLEKK